MKKTVACRLLVSLLSAIMLFTLMPLVAHAATASIKDSSQEDAYTDNGLADGYAYPVDGTYRLAFTNNLCSGSTLVNYVGSNILNFGLSYQRAAIKFSLTGISGTITSAQLKIHVVDTANNPVVNLISTTDNSWTQTNQRFPSYNSANIINGYANSPVTANTDKTFDVKDYVQGVVDSGASGVSFVLTGNEGGNQFFNFVSNLETNNTSLRPVLDVTYTPLASSPSVVATTPTNNARPTWTWTPGGGGNGTYRYKLDNSDLSSGATTSTAVSYTPGSALSEGTHTLYVQESNGASPARWSESGTLAVSIDLTPPSAPAVSATTPTNNTKPTWSWTPGGGGNGNYRYKLDSSDLSSGATTTTAASYTPVTGLSEGSHTLYVQERDSAGNWSSSGSFAVTVDVTSPSAPLVTGATPTNNTKPTWTWTPGGGGSGNYRYKLDNSDLSSGATTTSAASYTSGAALSEGSHTLYVQEQDSAGNWSLSGSFTVTVDVTPPSAPVVSGTTPTNNTKPTWTWTPGGGGSGNYRYKLDSSDLSSGAATTSAASYISGTVLSEGSHTLYVQERDSAGNWSSSGSFAVTIDITPPSAPTVSGTTPTTDVTPTWTWTPGGGGCGNYRYKLDSGDLSSGAATTVDVSYTPVAPLSGGTHTLYVQERDSVGNWSSSGSFAIFVDIPTVYVTGISVTGRGGANSAPVGATLQMEAVVTPVNATNKNITWSIASGSGASIDTGGRLSATAAGTVKVRATAQDGTGVYGETDIVITNPPPVMCTVTFVSDGTVYALKTVQINTAVGVADWPADPVKAGNTFAGWYTGADGAGVQFGADTAVNGSTTVYAKWILITVYRANKLPSKADTGTALSITAPAPQKGYTLNSITYTSSNPSVAAVDGNGVVTFLSGGKVKLVVTVVSQTVKNGKTVTKTTKTTKTINVKQPVSSITLNTSNTAVIRTETTKLAATVLPATASSKKVKWTTSNARVATVNGSGVVTGRGVGTAVITCTARDGSNVTASCTVTVLPVDPAGVKLSKNSLKLKAGKTAALKATVLPRNTDFKNVLWMSSDASIATVDSKGRIKAISPGIATITVITSNGKTAVCTVTVT